MDTFIGQIEFFPFFGNGEAPRGWHLCDGTLLPIAQYQALFALLGTQFGGDGRVNFALPKIAPLKTENGVEIKAFIALEGIFPSRN